MRGDFGLTGSALPPREIEDIHYVVRLEPKMLLMKAHGSKLIGCSR